MASYIMLFKLTERGIENIDKSPDRLDSARNVCRELGGEVKQFYALLGRYDTMFVLEAPDDERAAQMALAIGRLGNARAETIRAFTEAEYRQLVSSLPG